MITHVVLSGHQICDYIWVTKHISADAYAGLSTYSFEPSWTIDTSLLVTFNESLMAGNITNGEDTPTTWKIYREDANDNKTVLAGVIGSAATSMIDYNTKSNTTYTYTLRASSDVYITSPIETDPITPRWDAWMLFSVTENGDKQTLVINEAFAFKFNLTSDAMNNNLVVSRFDNFTPYAKIHKGRSNYYSGSLTSLLGYMDCSRSSYYDDAVLLERLKQFSNDGSRKFLKDPKGNIWEIEITSPVSASLMSGVMSGSMIQPYEINVGWSEIGTTNGLTITDGVVSLG